MKISKLQKKMGQFTLQIEELYLRYKHSVPSERSTSRSRNYFPALPEKKLDDEDMLYGERRDKAQIELELYILCQLLNGFQWNTETWANGSGKAPETRTWCCFGSG